MDHADPLEAALEEPPLQLAPASGDLPVAGDLAAAIAAAKQQLGHRPAITVLHADRRDEQGFASLAKWTAKGAHLLEIECMLEPGDRLQVLGPASWPLATACFAAWWDGLEIVDTVGGADVLVVDERAVTPAEDVSFAYVVGGAPDGAPEREDASVAADLEPWSVAVQTFPDAPPEPRATPDTAAVDVAGLSLTQTGLLAAARELPDEGAVGLRVDAPPELWLPAIVRPFVRGQPTVLLDGVHEDAAASEGVSVWLDT